MMYTHMHTHSTQYIQLTPQEQEVLRKLGDELFDLIPRENSDDFEGKICTTIILCCLQVLEYPME